MKIILSNVILIEEPTDNIIEWAKKELIFKNPEYEKKKRMGYYVQGTPRTIKLYDLVGNKLYIPYGCFQDIWKLHPVASDYVDYTVNKPIKVVIKDSVKLREYQTPALKAVHEYCNGIISMPCGFGKTYTALASIGEVKQKALWMASSIDLINQAKESCENAMECKTSFITDGKIDMSGDVVFATVQTVIKFIENGQLQPNDFGFIVYDEVQKLSANPKSFQLVRQCFEFFAARYKIGLSATVKRADGLENCIYKIVGDKIYNIEQCDNVFRCMYEGKKILEVPADAYVVPCHIKVIETDYNVWDKNVFSSNGGTIEFASLISDLAQDEGRNKLILKDLKKVKGSTIILGDRVTHLKYLCSQVENGVQIDGSTPKKKREKALQDMRDGKIKYLFASYSLCKEGLDIKCLENLFMVSPVKDFTTVVQSIGRIQRPYGDKKIAYVYDYVDDVGMLLRFYQKRRAIYRKNKWVIDNMYA